MSSIRHILGRGYQAARSSLPAQALLMWSDQKDIHSRTLKWLGAQPLRAVVAAGMRAMRRPRYLDDEVAPLAATLERDGLLVVPDYLPADRFAALRAEYRRLLATGGLREDVIAGAVYQRAFLLDLDGRAYPELARIAHDSLVLRLARANQAQELGWGDLFWHVHRVKNVPGERDQNQEIHTDTFHATTKGWLYLDDVAVEDGCFHYARGSHLVDPRRLRLEYDKSLHGRGKGSWRLEPDEAERLGFRLEPVPARANTLVVANTCGFHRRGESAKDGFRDALHFSARVSPFRA